MQPPKPGDVLRRKGGWSPVIRVVRTDGGLAIEKDYSAKPAAVRAILAAVLVRRERAMLRHLAGIPGIPRLLPSPDALRVRTEYVAGTFIHRFQPGALPEAAFRRLEALVAAMHARGVAHLDLRQRKNILVREDGQPFLLDFANAVRLPLRGRVARWTFERLADIDRSALLKYKNRLFPSRLTEEDRRRLRRHEALRKFWMLKPRRQSPKDRIR